MNTLQDLERVRQVRNYLEAKGASPLLFHLLALAEPKAFWPLIKNEIAARNFFLYCDSEAASKSEWVRLERATVDKVAKSKSVRVGSIRVDAPDLNVGEIDAFLAKTRVFASYAHRDRERVQPFIREIRAAGFQVSDYLQLDAGNSWQDIVGEDWRTTLKEELERTSRNGWVVVFLTRVSLASEMRSAEITLAQSLGNNFILVALEAEFLNVNVFDAVSDREAAPKVLVLLERKA
jgi:TIR domain